MVMNYWPLQDTRGPKLLTHPQVKLPLRRHCSQGMVLNGELGVHLCCWQVGHKLATVAKSALVNENYAVCWVHSLPLSLWLSLLLRMPIMLNQSGQWLKLADVRWLSHFGSLVPLPRWIGLWVFWGSFVTQTHYMYKRIIQRY